MVRKKVKKKVVRHQRKVTKTVTLEIPESFIEANLPVVIGFEDYHEIEHFAAQLEKIIPGVKHRELGMADAEYKSIFFAHKKGDYKRLVRDTEDHIERYHAAKR